MGKHTEGPWYSEKDIDTRKNVCIRIHSETIGDLASLTFYDEEDRDEWGVDNANLICAAPDMLLALEELVSLVQMRNELYPDHYAIKNALNIINNAKYGDDK